MREIMDTAQKACDFSGTILVKKQGQVLIEKGYGYRNRAEQLDNRVETRFGIASGCKLFTGIAICQLAEKGKLSFDQQVKDLLPYSLPYADDVTVHQLLTHTSGIADYFDEEIMDDFEALWVQRPMYHIRNLESFLPLFEKEAKMYQPGERFHYNNAGYILLGLIVEKVSNQSFSDYVQEHIFQPAGMERSGYFEMDKLPDNTALGYVEETDGMYKTNIYSLPVKGGSDGGAYTTVHDMGRLWDALMHHRLLNETNTKLLLHPHAYSDQEEDFYGYGVWIDQEVEGMKYHIMGYDPGVSFHAVHYPKYDVTAVVCSNESAGAYNMMYEIEQYVEQQK
ncbi:serine hydrolase [Ornithinibacillus gellani]|uniref:serine hydrolase domain-containing protein n=1 Tax=Ornithinibacillus gellani TaxID=2293253 RepID=UPI000F487A9F|nr:serine hydrolase [Ornithinibacillus gellani]TQS70555.1 serine hydrolase [Ornithinibacillus gellani]